MKKFVVMILAVATVIVAGCQPGGRTIFVETFKSNSLKSVDLSLTKPQMSAFGGFFVVQKLSGKNNLTSNLKCLNLKDGATVWWLKVSFDSDLVNENDVNFKAYEDKIYVNQGNTLVCFDLKTGGPIWQSRESIDYVLKADKNVIFCLSHQTSEDNNEAFRNLLCFDAKDGTLKWAAKIQTEIKDIRFGKDEISFYSQATKPITLRVISSVTGSPKKDIDGISRVFYNKDEPSDVAYVVNKVLFMHTAEKEVKIMNLDSDVDLGKIEMSIENNLLYIGSRDKSSFECFTLQGKQVWSLEYGIGSMIANYNNLICFDKALSESAYNLFGVNPVTGKEIWSDTITSDRMPSANVIGNYVLYPSSYNKIIIRSTDAGKVIQELEFEKEINSVWTIPAFGVMVICADGYYHFLEKID